MRTRTFRPYDQGSLLLMPPSVRDWVEPDGVAAFISDLVDTLDLAPFLAAHDEPRGMPPYHPRLVLKILLYGYATGVRSSRRIEERLRSDVAFMFLAGHARPDHKTIGELRRRHLSAFGALFLDILAVCQKAGHLRRGRGDRCRRGQALWRCKGRRAASRAANTRRPPAQDPRGKGRT